MRVISTKFTRASKSKPTNHRAGLRPRRETGSPWGRS